jgi:quercetin dioxygenase-like cupin family protein
MLISAPEMAQMWAVSVAWKAATAVWARLPSIPGRKPASWAPAHLKLNCPAFFTIIIIQIIRNVYRRWILTKIQALPGNALPEVMASPGITRHLAFKGAGFQVLRASSDPGVISGWHHHVDNDVYGFCISGSARIESETGEQDAITVGPGDFFHVPAHTVHREINPSQEEGNELVLFLYGSGPTVFNIDEPGQR